MSRAGNSYGKQKTRHRPQKVHQVLLLSGILSIRSNEGTPPSPGKNTNRAEQKITNRAVIPGSLRQSFIKTIYCVFNADYRLTSIDFPNIV